MPANQMATAPMLHVSHVLAIGLALSAALPLPARADEAAPAGTDARAALHAVIERDPLSIGGHQLDAPALRRFYAETGYDLVWVGKDDRMAMLSAAITASADHGFDVPDGLPDPFSVKVESDAERDVLISNAALRFAAAMATGRARPERFEEDWAVPAPAFDAVAGLERALHFGKLAPWLASLAPSDPRYQRLKVMLAYYRALAAKGGWPQVPGGPTLKPGMIEDRVGIVRKRLIAEGYLPEDAHGDDEFDPALEQAIRVFQDRHGIVPDGAVGFRTTAALNVTARGRVEQIALTLERWRSLPRDFGRNYAFVNVPAEELEIFEDGQQVMAMKVVVGDPNHPTPVVQSRIAAVTFNPSWRVPLSIAKAEIVPKLRADPHYLEKNDMVMKGAYLFEALPGPKNPLGQIKFETPNKFDVYLHDTSTHSSFGRVARALSHGCVRTEDARKLAAYVLTAPKWNRDEIEKAIATSETRHVDVQRHLAVAILYFTSFVDADGTFEFRDDLYGRDKRLRAALHGDLPAAAMLPKPKPGAS